MEWYPHVRDQAERCTWAGYDVGAAARDTILLQARDSKLQQKILAEDLNYTNTVKYGLSLEQGKKKVDKIISSRGRPEDTRVAKLEEEIRKLGKQMELKRTGVNSTAGRGSATVSCSTCTRPTHSKVVCPGKKVECYSCGLTGHFRGSTACKRKPAGDKAKTMTYRANQIDRLEEESDEGDSIGQVSEDFIRAAEISPKSRTAKVQLAALDGGNRSSVFLL